MIESYQNAAVPYYTDASGNPVDTMSRQGAGIYFKNLWETGGVRADANWLQPGVIEDTDEGSASINTIADKWANNELEWSGKTRLWGPEAIGAQMASGQTDLAQEFGRIMKENPEVDYLLKVDEGITRDELISDALKMYGPLGFESALEKTISAFDSGNRTINVTSEVQEVSALWAMYLKNNYEEVASAFTQSLEAVKELPADWNIPGDIGASGMSDWNAQINAVLSRSKNTDILNSAIAPGFLKREASTQNLVSDALLLMEMAPFMGPAAKGGKAAYTGIRSLSTAFAKTVLNVTNKVGTISSEFVRELVVNGNKAYNSTRDLAKYYAAEIKRFFVPLRNLSGEFSVSRYGGGYRFQYGDPEYWAAANASHGIIGFVDKNSVLGFDVFANPELRATFGTGQEMFSSMMRRIQQEGVTVNGIRGMWIKGTDSVNYSQFQAGISAGMTPQQAAQSTWTGKMASQHGYSTVESVVQNGNVTVMFRKP